MAVSKRTRYEVLRRDNHACRYCGAAAPTAILTVDHVIPAALGGGDDPGNLVAACKDCNSGKSSTIPGAPLVEDVRADNLRWSRALRKAAEVAERKAAGDDKLVDWFCDEWESSAPAFAELPEWAEVRGTVVRFHALGLSTDLLGECISIAAGATHVAQRYRWRYFCGICWSKITEIQEAAREILAAEEVGD